MSFVLDRSVTLAWCFEDERSDATDALLRQAAVSGAVAPGLWPLEVLNALAMGMAPPTRNLGQLSRVSH